MERKWSWGLMYISWVAAVLAGLVSVFQIELWLAGTQWMLIAVLLGVYGIFIKK